MNILTVGGFDPTGGAGIVADVKTIKELQKNPLSIITSIIPQNNNKVFLKKDLSKEEIKAQFDAIFEDFKVDWVKTGVLTTDSIDIILKFKEKYGFKIICDPVLKSTTDFKFSDDFLNKKYLEFFKECFLITPNLKEFEFIEKMFETSKFNLKDINVLVTGKTDFLKSNNKNIEITGKYVEKEVHGTGCTYSSAITCFLSSGMSVEDSIKSAKEFVLGSVIYAEKTKYGYNSNPTCINKESVEKNLAYAFNLIKNMDISLVDPDFIISESILLPKTYFDIAMVKINGDIKFGISNINSDLLLKLKEFNPKIRSCIYLKSDESIKNTLNNLEFSIFSMKLANNPVSSFEEELIQNRSRTLFDENFPDILYFEGKKPELIILGNNSLEIVKKLQKIEKLIKNR
ncbi:bifunctional hydroxymethylpyrimidine kinase/phosphomethylpyrimidine kinase [Methanococcus maripaludis]|uniref:Hydroxymethylpyrimidine/phosphomethylpyrimidine kinase n=1 Tax=Methanococcus maripaludis TaxID=39152 RepID=A0A7J9PQH9_METMI|nr:bifunctional hydroxymethylpyrimidine kinase/phosphomethylpyrimidine kinase [Methanococcus maripaludis]MBA2867929.1 hydroxymethylpyrimidine/phosphomethylpyrimidine kinase [Methanococcus maripaludis]